MDKVMASRGCRLVTDGQSEVLESFDLDHFRGEKIERKPADRKPRQPRYVGAA